jgi:hypothetical protein
MRAKQQAQKRTLGRQTKNPGIQATEKTALLTLSVRLSSEQYRRLRRFVRSFEDQTGQLRMQQVVLDAALAECLNRKTGSRPRWILEAIDIYAQPKSEKSDLGRSHMLTWRMTREHYRHLRLLVLDVEEQTGRRLTHQSILQSVLAKYMARNRSMDR